MTADPAMAETFRLAMRRLGASVTVLTLMRDGVPTGMAATAVCSLSFDPPSVLACINRSASLHDALCTATHFGVNLLTAQQAAIAARFADPAFRNSRFDGVGWHNHDGQAPLINGAQAALACRRAACFAHGTHTILVGEMVAGTVESQVEPLLYVDGGFAGHAPL